MLFYYLLQENYTILSWLLSKSQWDIDSVNPNIVKKKKDDILKIVLENGGISLVNIPNKVHN
jgi:hypothetical protein